MRIKLVPFVLAFLILCVVQSAHAATVSMIDENWDNKDLWYSGNRTVRNSALGNIGDAIIEANGELHVKTNNFSESINILKYLDGVSGNGAGYINGKLTPLYTFETRLKVGNYCASDIYNNQTAVMTVNVRSKENPNDGSLGDSVYRMVLSVEQDGIYMGHDYKYAKKSDGTPPVADTPNTWTKIVDEPNDTEWHVYCVAVNVKNAVLYIDGVKKAEFEVLNIASDGTNDDVMYSARGSGSEFYVDYTKLDKVVGNSAFVDEFTAGNAVAHSSENISFQTLGNYVYGSNTLADRGGSTEQGVIIYKVADNADITNFDINVRAVSGGTATTEIYASPDGEAWTACALVTHTFYEVGPTASKFTYRPNLSTPLSNAKYLRIILKGDSTAAPSILRVEIMYDSLELDELLIDGKRVSTSGTDIDDVPVKNQMIEITFNGAMELSTLNVDTVKLVKNNVPTECIRAYDAAKRTYSLQPKKRLDYSSVYTLVLSGDITNATGKQLAHTEYTLNTVSADFVGGTVTLTRVGNTVSAAREITNHSGKDTEVTLFIAAYKDFSMIAYNYEQVSIKNGESETIQTPTVLSIGADDIIVYTWDDLVSANPILKEYKE